MSQLLIQHYFNQLYDLRQASGTQRESVVREAFKDLLKGWARSHDLIFMPEYEITTPAGERRYVDGALLHALRIPFGYWESQGRAGRPGGRDRVQIPARLSAATTSSSRIPAGRY